MLRYAQWLDGSFFELLNGKTGIILNQQFVQTVNFLKMHALLGTEIVLSDVQLVDSHILLRLFTDNSFRNFLLANPRFFHYVAYPRTNEKRNRYDLLIRGPERLANPGNYASSFRNSEPAIEFANVLTQTNIDKIDPNGILTDKNSTLSQIIKKYPSYSELLSGMLYSICHFSNTNTIVTPSSIERTPYDLFEMISLALQKPKIPKKKEDILYLTKNFIEHSINNRIDQGRQAIIFKALNEIFKGNKRDPKYLLIKHTTNHAWHAAVEHTLASEGGLFSSLSPKSVQIGEFVDTLTDSLTPLFLQDKRLLVPRTSPKFVQYFLGRDPSSLTWQELAKIVKDTKSTAEIFQEALQSKNKNNIEKAIKNHISELSSAMTEYPSRHSHHAYLWVIGGIVSLIVGLGTHSWESAIASGHIITLPTEAFWGSIYLTRRYITKNTMTNIVQQTMPDFVFD